MSTPLEGSGPPPPTVTPALGTPLPGEAGEGEMDPEYGEEVEEQEEEFGEEATEERDEGASEGG